MRTLGSQKRIRYAHHPRCILSYTGMLLRLSGLLMLTPLLVLAIVLFIIGAVLLAASFLYPRYKSQRQAETPL